MTAAHWRTTTILVVALLTMGSLGSLYAWSVLIKPIEHEIGASRTASSVVFSAAIVCFTVAMLGAAELQQRATPATILLATTALAATGLALPGMSRSWPALLIGIGILLRRTARAALRTALGLSAAYLLVGVLGLILIDSSANFLAINQADNVLHLAVGALGIGVVAASSRRGAHPAEA